MTHFGYKRTPIGWQPFLSYGLPATKIDGAKVYIRGLRKLEADEAGMTINECVAKWPMEVTG